MFRSSVVLGFLVFATGAFAKENVDDVRVLFLGNSLINHHTGNDETTVPHWLGGLAVAGGKKFAADGQFGFMGSFSKELPPGLNWSFRQVRGVWNPEAAPFSKSRFNMLITNPANFIQYRRPDETYEGNNPDNDTPLGSTVKLFSWMKSNKPGLSYYIYEGWADMGSFDDKFPPSASAFKKYHAYNRGKYHAWYETYVKMVNAKVPGIDVKLIPVASVLSKLLTETPLRDIKAGDLYSDSAPHGKPTIYLLAALITYSKIYEAKVPEGFVVPASVHPLVKQNYGQISDMICAEIGCK